jgi:polar amino acid transport system substrate-binding protein
MRMPTRVLATLGALACLAGCAAPEIELREDRDGPAVALGGVSEQPAPQPSSASSDPDADPLRDECGARRSLDPALLSRTADGEPVGPALDRVRSEGLVVGLSQTAQRFSSRDLVTGELTGFEVDIVRKISTELFGAPDDERLHLRPMVTEGRLDTLRKPANGSRRDSKQRVDMVIADVSITCARVREYGLRFSAPYVATTSGLMVRKGSNITVKSLDDLSGRKVCSGGRATTNTQELISKAAAQEAGRTMKPLVPVTTGDTSDCLILLQRGQVDAIYTDLLILEGFRLQDPGMVVLDYRKPGTALAAIAMSDEDEDLVRFVNGVLDKMRRDGSLRDSFNDWFGQLRNPLPLPEPTYAD